MIRNISQNDEFDDTFNKLIENKKLYNDNLRDDNYKSKKSTTIKLIPF